MTAIPRQLLRLLPIALAAVVVASFGAGGASACTAMSGAGAACRMASGCCEIGPEAAPAAHGPASTTAAPLAESEQDCTAPAAACCCGRPQGPSAPEPKPSSSTPQGRDESPEPVACTPAAPPLPARPPLTSQVPATQSPPGSPLYLRNVRLLF